MLSAYYLLTTFLNASHLLDQLVSKLWNPMLGCKISSPRNFQDCKFWDLMLGFLNQKLWEWGSILLYLLGDSDTCSHLRTAALDDLTI